MNVRFNNLSLQKLDSLDSGTPEYTYYEGWSVNIQLNTYYLKSLQNLTGMNMLNLSALTYTSDTTLRPWVKLSLIHYIATGFQNDSRYDITISFN